VKTWEKVWIDVVSGNLLPSLGQQTPVAWAAFVIASEYGFERGGTVGRMRAEEQEQRCRLGRPQTRDLGHQHSEKVIGNQLKHLVSTLICLAGVSGLAVCASGKWRGRLTAHKVRPSW
jgi:hypothetical protein